MSAKHKTIIVYFIVKLKHCMTLYNIVCDVKDSEMSILRIKECMLA